MSKVYNRSLGIYEDEPSCDNMSLRFLYHTALGRVLLKGVVARPFFSKIVSRWQHSHLSRRSIKPFIEKNKIDVLAWNVDSFLCFNDFFIRQKDFSEKSAENELIAIADSRLSAYKICNGLKLKIKNSFYSVQSLLGNNDLAEKFLNGWCLVFRLCVDDYHRYAYPDWGTLAGQFEINGKLHTVRPIACDFNPYSTNHRVVNVLQTEHFGEAVQIEVGALMVGKVKNHGIVGDRFAKGQEKGYFEFGGSTVILLVSDNVKIDDDIVKNTEADIETKVKLGDVIGKIKN